MIQEKNHKLLTSIIIDDEIGNIDLLQLMLSKYCSSVQVIGSAQSAEAGYELISKTNPDIVFLDVKMPKQNGFDMLRMFTKINFHVIFVSAFDKYAIQAFEFNAIDYILKPIDHTKLIKAINKVLTKIIIQEEDNIIHFIHSLHEKNNLVKHISLHHNDRVHIVDVNEISIINALRGYTEVITNKSQKFISSKTLTEYEDLFSPFTQFLRINKSTIVNINDVKEYTKGNDCFISVRNYNSELEVSRRKKSEIIHYLKNKESEN